MKEPVIVAAARTPVGRYMGALKEVQAYDLAALVLNAVLDRAKIKPEWVDDVILGQSYQNGEYVNIARMALLKAGWPESIPGVTMDRRCCTGLDTVCFAGMMIRSGQAEVVVAGGVESMSNAEFYIPGHIKWGVGGKKGMPRGHGDLAIWGIPFYDRIQRARVMSQPDDRYGILPAMMTWAETAAKESGVKVAGFISPPLLDATGAKIGVEMVDLTTGQHQTFARIAAPGEPTAIGSYDIFEGAIEWARRVLAAALLADVSCLVVDEIGPLELSHGRGFALALEPLADPYRIPNAIVIVRSRLADELAGRLGRADTVHVPVTEANRAAVPRRLVKLIRAAA